MRSVNARMEAKRGRSSHRRSPSAASNRHGPIPMVETAPTRTGSVGIISPAGRPRKPQAIIPLAVNGMARCGGKTGIIISKPVPSGLDDGRLLNLITSHPRNSANWPPRNRRRATSVTEMWREFVFAILAGSRVRAETAMRSARWLFTSLPEVADPARFRSTTDGELSVVQALQDVGYRFPSFKAKAIWSAAAYLMERHRFLEYLLLHGRIAEARDDVADHVWGVGLKIASHWLRNCGFTMPVVDLHVRRALVESALLPEAFLRENITPARYRAVEGLLQGLASAWRINPAAMDYLIWSHARTSPGTGADVTLEGTCSICERTATPWNQ